MIKFFSGAVVAVAFVATATLATPQAQAYAEISIQDSTGSNLVDLSAIEDGSDVIANILNGSPSSGSVNVLNDTGSDVTSLTLYFNGSVDDGLDFQFNGNYSGGNGGDCTISTGGSVISTATSNGCQTAQNALATASYEFNLTDISPTITADGQFEITWGSFSNTDTGCIGGTSASNCGTVAAPAPLLGHGLPVVLAVGGLLLGAEFWQRSRKRRWFGATGAASA